MYLIVQENFTFNFCQTLPSSDATNVTAQTVHGTTILILYHFPFHFKILQDLFPDREMF